MRIKNRQLTRTYSLIPVVEGNSGHSDVEGIEDTLSSLLTTNELPLVQLFEKPVLVRVKLLFLFDRWIRRKKHAVAIGNIKPYNMICIQIRDTHLDSSLSHR